MSKNLVGETTAVGAISAPAPTLRRRNRFEIWLFLIPAILFQLSWGWLPLVMSFVLSFTSGDILQTPSFVGLDNYQHLWTDQEVFRSFQVTYLYSGLNILLTFALPIIAGIFIMEMPKRVTYAMMFLWFLPLSSITTIMLWRYFYDPSYGLFEYIATGILHLPHQAFLSDANQVLFWLVFPNILFFGPGLLYMATIQGIPSSYFEAAEVEGAGMFRKIWTITLPRLRPIVFLSLFLAIAGSLQIYDLPQFLTQGEPAGASRVVMMYVYKLIDSTRYGDATALSCIVFALTLAMIFLFRALVKEDPDA
ncbi:carbohydrate ABC transporter permease [Tengunoibacter tsumagoiensis]|uniref:ABC transporter permease n=1 Tax=Tengunoibacter tsumagoiensis TaxID=2014871 RepID=A0A402A6L0_9CHLR|nr:sugar ABC transporter permease [Tengunoibacter tsumagoiensis]GCE14783.1 ABC transporter permease [Tengunoibacter tsumagoiensis]